MPDLFEGLDEPGLVDTGMSRADYEMLLGAYSDELYEKPPVHQCNPQRVGSEDARRASQRLAARDVTRVDEAARRIGCTLKLVPLPKPNKRQNNAD